MLYIWAAVVLVGTVGTLNLILTMGIIRRLREGGGASGAGPFPPRAKGERVGEFHAVDLDGQELTRAGLTGTTLFGFFSPHCDACEERLPHFVGFAQRMPGGRRAVVAVIAGGGDDAVELREKLSPLARVVIEPPVGGPVAAAFSVRMWPAHAMVDSSGIVLASGSTLDGFRAPIPA